jgi:RNA polymerase sigma-70 factor (ECF subfamily)
MTDGALELLLARVARRDRGAFRNLFAASGATLYGVCLAILRNRGEAADALEEVLTRIWLNAHRHDASKMRAMPWMISIARTYAIDRLRTLHAGENPPAPIEPARLSPSEAVQATSRNEAQRFAEALARIGPDRAAAIKDAYVSGMSYEELSRHHDEPLNTLRSWLRKGLMLLKEGLPA